VITDEVVGTAEGVPSQRFPLAHRPVVPGERPCSYVADVGGPDGWEEWAQVAEFSVSRPEDRHFLIEETEGEIVFGPAVREPDGTMRSYGAVPPKGSPVRIREYRSGGGRQGNVARGAISVLKTPVPFVASVTNRAAGTGGADAEDIENAKVRGPLMLRTQQRAVTAEDYENLARAASREVARVRCVAAGSDGGDPGGVRVLLVPRVEDGEHGSLEFAQMLPSDDVFAGVAEHLDARRTIGARVLVQAPSYVSISVVASMRARPRFNAQRLEVAALEALYGYFHPVRGGPDGAGWPFGRAVVGGEVYAVLQRLRGLDFVEDVRLYPANPLTEKREPRTERIALGPHDLVFSWRHQVMVQPG
jgi:predicted phage baseplate assembly protein